MQCWGCLYHATKHFGSRIGDGPRCTGRAAFNLWMLLRSVVVAAGSAKYNIQRLQYTVGFRREIIHFVMLLPALHSLLGRRGLVRPGNVPPAHIVHLRPGSEPCNNHQWKAREQNSPVFRSRCVFGVWSVHSGDWRDRAGDADKNGTHAEGFRGLWVTLSHNKIAQRLFGTYFSNLYVYVK